MPRRIGLDVGGVIIDALTNDGTPTAFRSDRYMETTPVEGAYESVRELVRRFGAYNVFIISKCGAKMQAKTRHWLQGDGGENGFYGFTGFVPANLRFCLTWEEKAPIARSLGLTHFVDDRADVLCHMTGVVSKRYLFGPQSNTAQDTSGLIVVRTWADTLAAIMDSAA